MERLRRLANWQQVLAKLRVAPGLDGVVGAVLGARLGAVFLPQQHEGHALAAKLVVNASVVGLGVGVARARRRQQAPLQRGLIHGRYGLPIEPRGDGQAHVLGDNAFGEP
jgi:hypothetical protein